MMNFQELRMTAPGPLAPVPEAGQDLAPDRWGNRRGVALAGPIHLTVTQCALHLRFAYLQIPFGGYNRGFAAIRALVDVDLRRRFGRCRNIPPGGCFRT